MPAEDKSEGNEGGRRAAALIGQRMQPRYKRRKDGILGRRARLH